VSSADHKLTVWDFSVEPVKGEPINIDIPPQLMFLHLGQENIKELRFHPYYDSVLISTAQDSYNIFKPNFDPDQQAEDDSEGEDEEREIQRQTAELQKRIGELKLI
jgi:ribosome assembly protein RRB1